MRHDVCFPLYVEVDEIYNLACPASPIHYQHDPVQTTKTSVSGAINMLGLAKRLHAKIFQASTSEVYGDPSVHPQTEDYRGNVNPIGPRACYDEGKRCAETLFFDYYRQHKLRIRVARIFNTYGPRMHPNDGRVVSNFIVQALKGEPITIYGDGQQTRAFCYVDDLIEGFVRLMAAPDEVTGPINLGNPVETTVGELAAQDHRAHRLALEDRAPPAARSTIRCSAARTSPRRATASAGSRAWRSRRASRRPSPISTGFSPSAATSVVCRRRVARLRPPALAARDGNARHLGRGERLRLALAQGLRLEIVDQLVEQAVPVDLRLQMHEDRAQPHGGPVHEHEFARRLARRRGAAARLCTSSAMSRPVLLVAISWMRRFRSSSSGA